jgi:hypothetical protein
MGTDYTEFAYFTPPRAEAKIPSALLSSYERRGVLRVVGVSTKDYGPFL